MKKHATITRQSFCLIVDRIAGCQRESDREQPATLMVPPGLSYLVAPPDRVPQIRTAAPGSADHAFILNPLRLDRRHRLLLVSPAPEQVRLNAVPAPSVAVLQEKDQLLLHDGDVLLHVSRYVRPFLGPAAKPFLSQPCELCQIAAEPGTRIYVCPHCDAVLHHQTEQDADQETRLQCAAMTSTCPNCRNPIVTGEGLTYVPEEFAVA